MRYWYDTEFLEDGSTIELISIGIVAEDGREYYAVNRDAPWSRIHADKWLSDNVVPSLPTDLTDRTYKHHGHIANDVRDFLLFDKKPKLWAWYGAYDHVVLCQLWGKMIDLPQGIPMFTHDLRAMMDTGQAMMLPKQDDGLHNALADARHLKVRYEAFYGTKRGEGTMTKRNYEFRSVPGVHSDIKVSRDGEVQVKGRTTYSMSTITAQDGTQMTIQMCIYKAFPDIPMRYTPSW